MSALCEKSRRLTGYLYELLNELPTEDFEVITPREEAKRGCQISILAHHDAQGLYRQLQDNHVVCDYREPDVIRLAPVPLYNSFEDVWRFWSILEQF